MGQKCHDKYETDTQTDRETDGQTGIGNYNIDEVFFSTYPIIVHYVLSTYRVSQVKLDETEQLFQTENNPWSQKYDMYTFFRS